MSSTKPHSPWNTHPSRSTRPHEGATNAKVHLLFGSTWSRPLRRAWEAHTLDLQIEAFMHSWRAQICQFCYKRGLLSPRGLKLSIAEPVLPGSTHSWKLQQGRDVSRQATCCTKDGTDKSKKQNKQAETERVTSWSGWCNVSKADLFASCYCLTLEISRVAVHNSIALASSFSCSVTRAW